MTTTVTRTGLYQFTHEHYHSDPTPTGSLSSSGAHTLATECPALFDHQRRTREYKRAFDIGNASHLMTLEPDLFHDRVTVIRGTTKDGKASKGYQSQDAKEQRDAAHAEGKIPLLPEEFDMVVAMRKVLAADPIGRHAFRDGKAEQSIFWQDEEFGVWCRTRPDWIPTKRSYIINWKTIDSANPDDVARAIWNHGYFQKSSWELDGMEAVFGERPERFCLLFQSKKPPHLILPVWLHSDDLAWGAVLNRYARGVFAWCSSRGEWPSYKPDLTAPARAFDNIRLPIFAVRELERRHEAGEFNPPQMMMEAAE